MAEDQSPNADGATAAPSAERNGKSDSKAPGEATHAPSGADSTAEKHKLPEKPIYRRPGGIAAAALLLIVGGYFGIRYLVHSYHYESTDDAFVDGHVVQMSSKVSGYVADLRVTDNQLVKQGDVLLVIDQRDYIAARDQAQAAAEAARNRVQQASAQIETNKANLAAARATAKDAAANLARAKQTFAKQALSKEDLDTAVSAAKNANAQVEAAVANLATSELRVGESQASALQAEAQLRQAELNLAYTTISAPITGRVTRRTVELGNFLQPGQALFALVDPRLWVTANFKETQLTHMRVGQPVTIVVDAYPDRTLAAHIDSFQRGSGARFSLLPAENATGNYVKVVQRIPVKLVFNEPLPDDMILGPGMSVVPDARVR